MILDCFWKASKEMWPKIANCEKLTTKIKSFWARYSKSCTQLYFWSYNTFSKILFGGGEGTQAGGEGEAGSPRSREPDVGLDPRTLGS